MPKVNAVGDVISHEKLGDGTWVVVSAQLTGGGTGMGPHDVYPDGHQLTLYQVKEDDTIRWTSGHKKFYQSGCFVDEVMLPYCEPLRRVM